MMFRIRSITIAFLLTFFAMSIVVLASSNHAADIVLHGDELVKSGNYSEAIATYEQVIQLDSKNFAAWNGKADALNRAEKYTAALAASDTALAIEPSSTKGWINRGYILYNLGRYDDELKAYETAISLEPDNAEAWFNKGYALAGMKRYDEAIAAFDRVQAIRPDYPNLAANRRIAEQLRDTETPFFIRNAAVIAGILLVLVITGGYFLYLRKKPAGTDSTEHDNRQTRRRKEK